MKPSFARSIFFVFIFAVVAINTSLSAPAPEPKLSPLEHLPDWKNLDCYQNGITRKDFEKRVRTIYSPNGTFFKYLRISNESVTVYRDKKKQTPLWTLRFAASAQATKAARPAEGFIDCNSPVPPCCSNAKLQDLIAQKPLNGIKICLDPGHIGGEWAKMEERSFNIHERGAVEEARLNLRVCRLLASLLKQAGAEVVWTKETLEPVTQLRPCDLRAEAKKIIFKREPHAASYSDDPHLQQRIEEQSWFLFYRTAEIHARAERVNKTLKPDLTLCIHHNASGWDIPKVPNLTDKNRLVVFTHGAYMAFELEYDDQKYALMRKLLENKSTEEIALAECVARQMERVWDWPPEKYEDRLNVWPANSNPYIWHRNLLASRLFNGPVVFIEGPYMNNTHIYKRLLAGDYDGMKKIDGKMRRSLYREFAEIVAQGVMEAFSYWRSRVPIT